MTTSAQEITITLTLTKTEFLKACMIAGIDGTLEPEEFKQYLYDNNPLLPFVMSHARKGIHSAITNAHAHEFPGRYPDDFSFYPQE